MSTSSVLLMMTMMAMTLLFIASVRAVSIDVMPMRIDNPKPDGSGVAFIKLKTDPRDSADAASLDHFKITAINFDVSGQALKLWDPVDHDCSGTVLSAGDSVPADGKVCFWSDTSSVSEFQSSFSYAAVDNSATPEEGTAQTVTVVNYNVQTCPAIPDLGESGFATAPPSPDVSITLSGLQIKFEVTASYLRNQTAWMVDFFDFNSAAGGDSADGTGRTCSNHASSLFTGKDFSQWWLSQPRANFDDGVHTTIQDALNNGAFPMYDPSSTKWTVTNVGCDKVKYTATIPTANLISNGASDCKRPGSTLPAASANGLIYSATLYVVALRPKDLMNSAAGYYKSSFVFPFSFRLQQEVSDIETTSSAWAFSVAVESLLITQGANLVLQLETTISRSGVNSPDMAEADFALVSYPNKALRQSVSKEAVLTRVSTNGNCGTSTTSACTITWQVTLPELTLAQVGGTIAAYNQQYIGQYAFTWRTSTNDALAANLIINAAAANSTDLGQLEVPSSVDFFRTATAMYVTANSGMAVPTFSSGEQVWVRHSFQVDDSDVAAYRFTLKTAWVCWSPVQDFTPTLHPGTGCSQDIPGVMEAALGHRILLFNASVGIADETYPAGSTRKSKIWGWTQVLPTSASWSGGRTVQNGFGINALPLVTDAQIRTYYFHIVSEVSQAPLPGRRQAGGYEVERLVARAEVVSGSSGSTVKGITVITDQSTGAASRTAVSWLSLFL